MMRLFYSSSINNCENFPLYFECDYCPKLACRSVNMHSQIVTHTCQDGRVVMCRAMPWQVCITPYKMRIYSQNGMPTRQVISHYTLWTCMCLLFKKLELCIRVAEITVEYYGWKNFQLAASLWYVFHVILWLFGTSKLGLTMLPVLGSGFPFCSLWTLSARSK